MTHDGDRIAGRARVLTLAAVAVAAAGLVGVMARVAWLQTHGAARLAPFAAQRDARWTVEAPRGDLLDRAGRPLATTTFVYQPVIDPAAVPSPPDVWIVEVSDALGIDPMSFAPRLLRAMPPAERSESAEAADADRDDTVRARAMRIVEAFRSRFVADQDDGSASEGQGIEASPAGERVVRYLPFGDPVSRREARRIERLGFRGLWFERRPVRDRIPARDMHGLARIVGKEGVDENGRFGAERLFHDVLSGVPSRIGVVRDARGRTLWVERGASDVGVRGEDVRLSIDLGVQRIAMEELRRGVEQANAAGGRIVALDPSTGDLLAMADIVREVPDAVEYPWVDAETGEQGARLPGPGDPKPRYRTIRSDPAGSEPALARPRCMTDVYEPGSVFKSLVWAAALDMGLMEPEETITTEPGGYVTPYGRRITDVTRKTEHTWNEVLVRSSNIGMAMLSERMTHNQLRGIAMRFGFGRPTGLGIRGEASGLVTPAARWNDYSQTSVAMGHEIAVTPLQLARAFCAIARTGEAAGTLPPVALRAAQNDRRAEIVERVLSPEAAAHTRGVLEAVVERADEKMRRRFPDEPAFRYRLFGKSGTAEIPLIPPEGKRRPRGVKGYYPDQYNAGFVAGGPLEAPALVVLVVIDDPGPGRVRQRRHYGSDVAAPVVRRVFERVLPRLGIPGDRVVAGVQPPVDEAARGERPATMAFRLPVPTMASTNFR